MRKVNNVARLSVTLLVTCVMILGLIPVPALAEMRDVVDTAEVAKKDFSEGEQLTPQEMSNGTPADSPKEKSGDAVGELGEENAVPLTESNAASESPEPAEASSELLGRATTEVREACSARVDLGEAEEQARLVATLFDACVAITARNEGTSSDANGTPDLYRQLAGMTDDAQAPAFAAFREMLAKDVTDKGVADTFVRMLHELGVEHLEVEGANGARWAMVRVGDAWYHVDPVAAAKAVTTGDEAAVKASSRLWLLVSSETIRAADPARDPWNVVLGVEVPTADHDYRWEPEVAAPAKEAAIDSALEYEKASDGSPADTNDRSQTSEPEEPLALSTIEEPVPMEGSQEAGGGKSGEESVEEMDAATLREKLRSQNGTSIPEMGTQALGEPPILSTQSDEGTRERFVEVVREQEDGTGYGTYISSWYDWCAAFVQRCADWSGVSDDVIPRGYNYVTTFRDKLLEHGGQWLPYWENPQPGDLIFYNNLNYSDLEGDQASGDDLNHVGIVAWTDDDGYTTKEGNGGGGTGVVNSKRHWYGRNYTGWSGITYIVGFVRPNWPQSDPGPTVPDWGKFGGDANLPTGYYSIRPVLDTRKYLEIAGGGTNDGENVQIWGHSWPGECEHIKWHLNRLDDGSYGVDTFAAKVLDVSGGSQDDGANVLQYSWTGANQQRWYIHDCGNGTYALEAKHSGKFLDLAGGGTDSGTNVQQWSWYSNDNTAQKWVITPCEVYGSKREVDDGWWYVRSAVDPSYALDVADSGNADGDNLHLWDWCKSEKQKFKFVRNDDETYRVETMSGKVFDVAAGSRSQGANVQQWSYGGVDQQRWWIQDAGDWKVAIQSKNSGLYIDLSGGICQNGQNIQQWSKGEGHEAKWWYLTPAHEGTIANVPDGTYEIVTTVDDKSVVAAMQLEGDDYAAMAGANGSLRQRFTLTNSSDGSVRIKNLGNDSFLDVKEASLAKGANNNFWSDTDTPQQHWYIEDAGSGSYSFRNKWTNWYLDVSQGDVSEGNRLCMFSSNGTASQKFKLRRLTLNDATIDAIANQVYTGSAIAPKPTVRFAGRVLTEGVDYTVSYSANVAVGTATVKVTGANGFEGSKSATFNIAKANLSSATLSAISDKPYTGSAVKPEPTVTLGGKTLVKGTDYTISWSNNTNVGTATVTAKGKGNYTGSKSTTFKIVAATAAPAVFVSPDQYTYDGTKKSPSITVTASGKTLTKGTDYDLSYTGDFTNVGTHTVKATLKGNYSGSAQASVQIAAADISSGSISSISNQAYTGSAIKPEPSVALNGKTLSKNIDYTVTWTNNTNVGTATVTVTGKGNYTGSKSATFAITRAKIAIPTGTNSTYNGKVQTGVPEGYGYSVTGTAKAISAGSYNATVVPDDNHMWADGTMQPKTVSWSIARRGVTVRANNVSKSVGAADPQLTASVLGTIESETVAYRIERERGETVGTYEILVTGDAIQDNYEVSFSGGTFTIARGILDNATVEGLPDEVEYNGGAQTPVPTVKLNGRVLQSGTDYSVGYYDNVGPGTASIVVMGAGDYSGAIGASFRITPANIANASFSDIPDQVYTSKGIEPKPTVKVGTTTLEEGTDYTLSWSNNVKPGTATVTVTGKGNFTGTKSVTFQIKVATKPFPDVPSGAWYEGVVYRAASLGLLSGYSNGRFGPGDKITRGQVAVILWNMAGNPAVGAGAKTFSDVGEKDYYRDAVRWASSVGVVSGYGNGRFGPKDDVTREQLAVMLANYAKNVRGRAVTGSATDFALMADRGKVSSWAVSSVGWCFKNQILSGSGGNVNPHGNATRAEAAKMVVGLYDLLG